jgi:hypothetical protein
MVQGTTTRRLPSEARQSSPAQSLGRRRSITYRFPQPNRLHILPYNTNPGPLAAARSPPHDFGLSSLTRFSHVRSIDFDGFPQACLKNRVSTPTRILTAHLVAQPDTYECRGLQFVGTRLSDSFFIFLGTQATPGDRQDLDCNHSHDF